MGSFKLGDSFPDTYFPGNSTMKKNFIESTDFSEVVQEGRAAVLELINSASLSSSSAEWCKACFEICPKEFFYMPTASTGKYHGGPLSPANSIGGNIVHTREVLAMSSKVLNRYSEALGIFYEPLSEALKVACILHDIAKYGSGDIWTSKTHGEQGAELLKSVSTNYDFAGLVMEAVAGHMYYWKFSSIYNSLETFGAGSLNGLFLNFMLSECDFYSAK